MRKKAIVLYHIVWEKKKVYIEISMHFELLQFWMLCKLLQLAVIIKIHL